MRPRPAPVPAVTLIADAAPDTERGFRELADAVATRTGCHVIAWGTAPIADDDQPRRFAVLDPDHPGLGRGAYLIEDAATSRWLVSYAVDGRTLPWALQPGASRDDPHWQIRHDRAVEHAQASAAGGETVWFALHDGALVVTGKDGACARPCRPLRDLVTLDADLQVTGPAASVSQLTSR